MIYVIKIYGPKEETSIKIGYTEDKNFNIRMQSYKTHYPFYELLYTIPDCTEDDEKKLHYYFRKYNKETEWFEESEEIIEFFNTHKTKESIDKLGLVKKPEPKRPKFKAKSTLFREELARWIKDNDATLSDIVKKVLKSFLKRKGFYYIMKFICENKVSEDEIELILSKLPDRYKDFYTTLGPEKCKANGYKLSNIKAEFESTYLKDLDLDSLKSKILSEFKVGEKYLKSEIKEKLRDIYTSESYAKTPKANDLEDYFEIKDCLVSKDGKKSHGFEIIKEK